jgi:hypothetical protein
MWPWGTPLLECRLLKGNHVTAAVRTSGACGLAARADYILRGHNQCTLGRVKLG